MTTSPPTLEELFLRHYGEDIAMEDAEGQAKRVPSP
jgi:hypothetical protein